MSISSQDLFSIVGWLVILFFGYRFVNRRRHPDRNPLKAFLLFIGIFGGIAMAGLIVFSGVSAMFDENTQPIIIRSLSGFFVLAFIIPGWKFAVSRVSSTPSPAENSKKTDDKVESLMKEVQALSPSERESLANHLEAIADMKESSELHTKIVEKMLSTQSLFKGWLTAESVYDTFGALQVGMNLEAVARINRIVISQADSLKALILQWRKLNPTTEDRNIDTLTRVCGAVLANGHAMKVLIARRRRELNPNAVPTPEDAELLAQWGRLSAFAEQQR